jgi:catechol 2,3-dioxygenase-like lactoylglutathione lyase family enzyme
MPIQLDHMILNVNDRAESVAFYSEVLGLAREADDGPFSVIRVTPELVLLLSPAGSKADEHLAFSMSRGEFDAVLARLVERKIPYGDRYNAVGNMQGPGEERGARGQSASLYFFDPSHHLIEIKHYER